MNNIVIFDLEATCWHESENIDRNESEIIEIGAVKVNNDFDVIDSFQTFIRPVEHPKLSKYCTDLTSIRQEDVDSAQVLQDAMLRFERWSGENPLFMSWGDYDRNQVTKECERKHYKGQIVKLVQNHKNIKWIISRQENVSHLGLGKAMKRFHMTFEGTHHRGIDDVRNIARVAKKFKEILI